MDKIHELNKKPWISCNKINLKSQLDLRNAELIENNVRLADCNHETANEIERELEKDLQNFVSNNEKAVKPYFLFNSTDEKTLVDDQTCQLRTYQLQKNHAKRMISDRAYKVNYLSTLATTRRELLMRHLASSNRQTQDSDTNSITQIDLDPSIVAIVVVQFWTQPSKNVRPKLEKEILFRSTQSLTDLRDQVKCQRDYGVAMDLSESPEQAERIFCGELFKSGFILVGDTFYNDMRDPNNIDLSANIIDWAEKEVTVIGEDRNNVKTSRGIGPFRRVKMEEHTFNDLVFMLGCPYLYLHQGDCEHLFTISDIRYVSDDITLRNTKFPFVTATSIGRQMDHLRCYMCKSRPPHWYTRNNERLPLDPYFFCENCFYTFNYDERKRKIGAFQAYLYTSTFDIPDSVVIR